MTVIAAVDTFMVATVTFKLLYAVIVHSHHRRRVIHFEVTQNPTKAWLARQIIGAFPWDTAPRYLLRDRDTSYGTCFQNRVRAMRIEEVLTAPRSPWQNPYVERIVGLIRRDCLDDVIIAECLEASLGVSPPTALRFFKSLLANGPKPAPEISFGDLTVTELLHKIEPTWSVAQPDLSPQMSDLVSFPWARATYELVQGAPRPMKMGTTRSPFPYDAAARHALQSARLRYPTTLHYASRALPSILGGSSACPSITALSINPGTDVMGTKPEA